jgi:hypothetical protein
VAHLTITDVVVALLAPAVVGWVFLLFFRVKQRISEHSTEHQKPVRVEQIEPYDLAFWAWWWARNAAEYRARGRSEIADELDQIALLALLAPTRECLSEDLRKSSSELAQEAGKECRTADLPWPITYPYTAHRRGLVEQAYALKLPRVAPRKAS